MTRLVPCHWVSWPVPQHSAARTIKSRSSPLRGADCPLNIGLLLRFEEHLQLGAKRIRRLVALQPPLVGDGDDPRLLGAHDRHGVQMRVLGGRRQGVVDEVAMERLVIVGFAGELGPGLA